MTSLGQVPQNLVTNLGSGDSAMLATWYLESFTKDTLGGYDYGIPIVNYSLTGFLPLKYFPWKYFLLDSASEPADDAHRPWRSRACFTAESPVCSGVSTRKAA